MRKIVSIVLISFVAGIGGAAFYTHFFVRPNVLHLAQNQEVSGQIRDVGYSDPDSFFKDMREGKGLSPVNENFITASKNSRKSVVYIKTISQTNYRSSWMDWFFGESTGQAISSGSGVIYSKDGYIMTNNHVIDDADQIEVIIQKKPYPATLVGTDPSTDIAVLKVEGTDLPAITFGESSQVEVGEWVLAVGNPFNLTSTVTAGIVSAKGRELNIMKANFPIESFIQTDAAINPGNSGGALVNMEGELIGINTAILSRTGSYAGYGFAVPSDIVKKVVDDLINFGEVQKAFIGAEVIDIDADVAGKLGIDDYSGVVLSYVQEDGAAAKAGMAKGDIITKINNIPVDSRSMFEEVLSYHSPGDKLNITYKRDSKIVLKELVLTNKEGTTKLLKREIFTSKELGADFEKVSKVERDLYNIDHGIRVVKVNKGLIQQMDLQEGFIITHINRTPIDDPNELADILTKIRGRVILEGFSKRGRKEYYRYYF